MNLTVDGMTILTVLKKIVASTIEGVQQLAIQVLSNIIHRDPQQEYCFQILQTDIIGEALSQYVINYQSLLNIVSKKCFIHHSYCGFSNQSTFS